MSDTEKGSNGAVTFFRSIRFKDWLIIVMLLASIISFSRTRASVEDLQNLNLRVTVLEELMRNDLADIKLLIIANREDMKELRQRSSTNAK
jgi:hypothetical protein